MASRGKKTQAHTRGSSSARPNLRRLARAHGVVDGYVRHDGRRATTGDAAREAILMAMGIDASTEGSARKALAESPPTPTAQAHARPCPTVAEALGRPRGAGLCVNLYSLTDRGRSDFGDLTTLAKLIRVAGRAGAAFVGINPINAIRARGGECSPYGPTSRLFDSFLYLDLAKVPEVRDSSVAQRVADQFAVASRSGTKWLDYDRLAQRKERALRSMFSVFLRKHAGKPTARGRAHDSFVAERGELLESFATFAALDGHFRTDRGGGGGWRDWPQAYRRSDDAAVERFRAANAREVAFHRWVQFELDRQLAGVVATARRAGVGLGVYKDLPVGSLPSGFDAWRFQDLFCTGVSVGAPPDSFFAGGQNWGLAPINPLALSKSGFVFWRELARAGCRHAGMLRIDHVMGLARQYWIPHGMGADEGAYVRMPADALFRVVAEESRRAGTVVVGEDLGTVPEEVPHLMKRWGLLSSRVVYFERTGTGAFRSARAYRRDSLATVTTHDLPTVAGYVAGRDIEQHVALGTIEDEARGARMLGARRADVAALARRVGLDAGSVDSAELIRAVHRFLASTNAALVGVNLDDLAGEVDSVNLPGVSLRDYPSWQRRMARTLQQLQSSVADLSR